MQFYYNPAGSLHLYGLVAFFKVMALLVCFSDRYLGVCGVALFEKAIAAQSSDTESLVRIFQLNAWYI